MELLWTWRKRDSPHQSQLTPGFYFREVENATRLTSSGLDSTEEVVGNAIYSATEDYRTHTEKFDQGAVARVASLLGDQAQKDIEWQKALNSNMKDKAIAAYEKEMASLLKNILKEVTEDDPRWEYIKRAATTAGLLEPFIQLLILSIEVLAPLVSINTPLPKEDIAVISPCISLSSANLEGIGIPFSPL